MCGWSRLLPVWVVVWCCGMAAWSPAWAHRVNIVAWVEGAEVVSQSAFSNGHRVRQGRVTVADAVSGAVLLEGRTDAQGVFRFAPPEDARAHGLTLRIDAGAGHQNRWMVSPEELGAAPQAAPGTAEAAPALTPGAARTETGPTSSLDAERLRAIVDAALEAKLGPIRGELAAMRAREPGLTEIGGGIGWLVGLAGLLAYFRRRGGRKD